MQVAEPRFVALIFDISLFHYIALFCLSLMYCTCSSFAKHRARKAEQKKGVGMLPSEYDDDDFAEIRFMISRCATL